MQTNDILLIISSFLFLISELLPFVPIQYKGVVHGFVVGGDEIIQCLNKPQTAQSSLP